MSSIGFYSVKVRQSVKSRKHLSIKVGISSVNAHSLPLVGTCSESRALFVLSGYKRPQITTEGIRLLRQHWVTYPKNDV